jgi:hypothetical protein
MDGQDLSLEVGGQLGDFKADTLKSAFEIVAISL